MRKMGMAFLRGKSIMSISLPVQIFSKTTQIQSLASYFSFYPIFGMMAAKETDPVKWMRELIWLCFVSSHFNIMEKPFNPILGETYQATVGDFDVYVEQISHHPPISSFLLESKDHPEFKAFGNIEYQAITSMNSVKGSINGTFNY
jgi:hypothetical protein